MSLKKNTRCICAVSVLVSSLPVLAAVIEDTSGPELARAASLVPETGLWAIDSERNGQPGRGFTLEAQNGTLVLTIFGYDSSGSDAFYQAAGPINGTSFTGTLNYYRNGMSFGGLFKSANLAGSAGTVTINFTSSTLGTISLPGETAKSFSKFSW